MVRPRIVWGIEIGQCALKALRLRDVEGILQVEAFDVIEHPMILSQPEADRQQIIREALQRFLAKADVSGCHVVISVPGQSSFSRFVKLPPVESRRVPDIVRFEAEQQIPFPINEVIWRWQTFRDPDSPDVEVGLFAMKRSDVAEMLSHFDEAEIRVDTVQTAPLALYNFMTFDEQLAEDGATLLADIGADKTDLVVADKGRIWTRTIQIGGNNFTEALVRTFKLSFEKAEKLKRAAASSKYARQIFQSMRPVFADLVQEVQRSVGYYTSLHRDTRFRKVIGLGNGFRLPGLQKFVEQNLNVPVTRIDSYNRIAPSSSASAPAVNEHVLSFAVAYGLAVQGLELSEVGTNLLPEEILRKRRWNRKRPWFVAAAAVFVAALFCPGYRARLDSSTLESRSTLHETQGVVRKVDKRINDYEVVKGKGTAEEEKIKSLARLFGYREFWPSLLTMISRSIEAVAPDQPRLIGYARYVALKELHRKIHQKIAAGKGEELSAKDLETAAAVLLGRTGVDPNSPAALKDELAKKAKEAEAFKATERKARKTIVLESLTPTYVRNLALARVPTGGPVARVAPAAGRSSPGFKVEMVARTPLPRIEANKMAADLRARSVALARWLGSLSVEDHEVAWLPMTAEAVGFKRPVTGGPAAARIPDPLMPDDPNEDMAQDTRFKITWWVAVEGDGIVMADVKLGQEYKLSKDLELMPEFDPTDAVAAAKDIQVLKPGTIIAVGKDPRKDLKMKGTTPWYQVKATDAAGKGLRGWVSGAVLDKQKLEDVTAEP